MKRTVGKLITILLCLTMILSLVPVSALASEEAQAQIGVVADIPGGSIGDIIDELGKLPDLVATPTPDDPTGSCGEALTWHLSPSTGVLTVSGSGAMPDYASNGAPWYSYRGKIKSVVLDAGITNIGAYAFDGLANMTAIELPASIERIGNYAFVSCVKLADITLPDSITEIGIGAFENCTALTGVTLPAGVHKASDNLFKGCTALTEVLFPVGETELGASVFDGCAALNMVVYHDVTKIGTGAFRGCTNMTVFNFPDTLTEIGKDAFSGSGLKLVKLPKGLTTVDFLGGTHKLTTVFIPASVKTIEMGQFAQCKDLKRVDYEGSKLDWKNIRIEANNDMLKNAKFTYNIFGNLQYADVVLTSMPVVTVTPAPTAKPTPTPVATPNPNLPGGECGESATWEFNTTDGTLTIRGKGKMVNGYKTEAGTVVGYGWNKYQSVIKKVVIEEGITHISDNAFKECTGLKEVVMPESVTSIGDMVFWGTWNVEKFTIHPTLAETYYNSVPPYIKNLYIYDLEHFLGLYQGKTTAGEYTGNFFTDAENIYLNDVLLTDLVIPEGFTSVPDSAFSGCNSLKTVTLPDTVTTIGEKAFFECENLKDVKLSENLKEIEQQAFDSCKSLTSVTIPASVEIINGRVFSNVKTVIFEGNAPLIAANAFSFVKADAYYPAGNSTWTAEKKENYGGELNWIEGLPSAPTPVITPAPTAKPTPTPVATPNPNLPGGECGENAKWSFDESTNTLTIYGKGEMADYENEQDPPWYANRGKIKTIVVSSGITSVGRYAFNGCQHAVTVSLPESLEAIGSGAFSHCKSLESITLPNSIVSVGGVAFYNCDSLTEVTLPKNLTEISSSTFSDCGALRKVVLPKGLTKIESDAFNDCSALSDINFPNGLTSIGNDAFARCYSLKIVNIPATVTSIGRYAFGDSGLEYASVPNGITTINFFGDCWYLKAVYLPKSVAEISRAQFWRTESLADIYYGGSRTDWEYVIIDDDDDSNKYLYGATIHYNASGLPNSEVVTPTPEVTPAPTAAPTPTVVPTVKPEVPENPHGPSGTCGENATWVLDEATGTLIISGTGEMKNYGWSTSGETNTPWYSNRAKIKSIVVEEGITSIGNGAFSNCVRAKSIALPDSLVTVGGYAFAFCKSLETIDLPDSITEIRSDAFRSCEELTRIVLPKNITAIPSDLFIECTSLMEVIIPESVTTIGGMAFYGCKALTKIILPEGLTSIDLYTFASCKALETLVIPNSVSQISAGAFSDCAIKYLSLPNTLDSVNYLGGLYALEAVYIPKEVLLIESGQFSTCTKFTDVYYGGSEAEWKEVFVDDNNKYLSEATIHYNCTGLPESMVPVTPTPVITPAPTAKPTPTPAFVPDPNWKHGDCGENAKWYFDDSTGTLHVIGSGRLNNYGAAMPPPWYSYGDPGEFCHLITKAEFSEGITFLGAGFLWGCNITEFTVPSTVTEIDCFFFEDCARLTNIVIPKSVKTISTFAFAGCGVKNVYYEGTEEEWKQIEIGEEGNGALFNANIVYSYDGSPIPTIKPTTTPTPTPTAKPTPTPYVPVEPTVNPNLDPTTCKHTLFFVAPKNATCTEQGFTGKVICGKGCGHVLQEGKVKPALGHNYKNGSCTRCGHVDGAPVVPPPAGDTPFVDMTTNDWFYEPVLWAVENGITGGTSANTFSPDGICTRAQIVTFLWAAAGKPEPTSKSPFADVKSDDWFYKPVIWAVENDITSGTTASTFSPNIPCSRAQVVALLYKAMGAPEVKTTENPFADVNENNYFYPAVLWALENKVASGVTADKFGSSQPCTRAQIAMFLYKAYN